MGENFPISGPGFIPGAPPLNSIDTGVFINELTNLGLLPDTVQPEEHEIVPYSLNPENHTWKTTNETPIPDTSQEVTYRGTQLALLKTYGIIEHRYHSFMETTDFDPTLPPPDRTAEKKRKLYVFTHGKDGFPPHLNIVGKDDEQDVHQRTDLPLDKIFDGMRLIQAGPLMRGFLVWWKRFIARKIADFNLGTMGTPEAGKTLKEVEDRNRKWLDISKKHKGAKNDIFDKPNVGELEDWYSDAGFAQQQFTGVNPTTIKQASDEWLDHFIHASEASEDKDTIGKMKDLKNSCRESLYMQDYSYFRKAAGKGTADDIKLKWEDGVLAWKRSGYRYNCASVCLYYLNEKGELYPLAIVTDWRGSARDSVTIFNRKLFNSRNLRTGHDRRDAKQQLKEEAEDWPWRYAKTCVQCSDWFQHEVTAHLTNTHFVEEAIIVASNRRLDDKHAVLQLLRPHWRKTLALNSAARSTLVPHVVLELVGFQPKEAQNFMWDAYTKFDFKKNYVPADLKERGFPPEKLGDAKFHNYAYAKCINSMWANIRQFVQGVLAVTYPEPGADDKVKADRQIQDWVEELQSKSGAQLNFPTIQTFDELVDCVTMCIHIASPQHTAVNYLQNYYLSFVVNKPPCLFEKPPETLKDLLNYHEEHLVKALPMNQPAEWLLASHIPYLLNKDPDNDETLFHYAQSKAALYATKTAETDRPIAKAAIDFLHYLEQSKGEFEQYGKQVDSWERLKYQVLYPESNAVSILI